MALWVSGPTGGGVPRPASNAPGAQDDEWTQLPAEVGTAASETGAAQNIWQAETQARPGGQADAEKAFDLFIKTYEPKYPKAAICLQKDHEELMACYDFPAQHWQSIQTSNPIESTLTRSATCLR